jgi:hypothetical protein
MTLGGLSHTHMTHTFIRFSKCGYSCYRSPTAFRRDVPSLTAQLRFLAKLGIFSVIPGVQTGAGVHPAASAVGIGVKHIIDLNLVPRLQMHVVTPGAPHVFFFSVCGLPNFFYNW